MTTPKGLNISDTLRQVIQDIQTRVKTEAEPKKSLSGQRHSWQSILANQPGLLLLWTFSGPNENMADGIHYIALEGQLKFS